MRLGFSHQPCPLVSDAQLLSSLSTGLMALKWSAGWAFQPQCDLSCPRRWIQWSHSAARLNLGRSGTKQTVQIMHCMKYLAYMSKSLL